MSTDTLPPPVSESKSANQNTKNSWLAIGIMFIAGLAGGGLAFALVSHQSETPRFARADVEQQADFSETTPSDAEAANAAALQEVRELREEVEQLRAAKSANVNSAENVNFNSNLANQRRAANSFASAGQRTLNYWNQLNSIMSREAAMRAAPPQVTAGNAMSFVSGQTSAYEYAGSAIRQLNTKEVDPQAVAIGREIAEWYDRGVANSRQAESLLGSNDIALRQGAVGQGWSTAEKQHREECLAINRRGEQLRQELSQKYGIEFPALQ